MTRALMMGKTGTWAGSLFPKVSSILLLKFSLCPPVALTVEA